MVIITFLNLICWIGGQLLEGIALGRWDLLLQDMGLSAMHMTLTHVDTVIIFDQTQQGCPAKELGNPRPNGCWTHSAEYNIAENAVRPLHISTDTFCSSGSFMSNGTLVQTGGWHNGEKIVRYFSPCSDSTCDWLESKTELFSRRWYSSNQILPDGRAIVVGGRRSFNYEFIPKNPSDSRAFNLPFLVKTNVVGEENNLYPFLCLAPDGNLFIFANNESILLDYKKDQVVKTFPTMPGGGSRSYPSTASSALLPLDSANNFQKFEIIICGGAPVGAFKKVRLEKTFVQALSSCGRMEITSENPQWQMENMPGPRVMSDMLILPTGELLIVNGAKNGTAGWLNGREPELQPVLYNHTEAVGNRFRTLASSTIPRMYHSTAIVLPDGRVLVAGSNPNAKYRLAGKPFPTEMRMEAYIPYYLHPIYDLQKATITDISTREIEYGSQFIVHFFVLNLHMENLKFHLYAPPFNTHSMSMNQRMLSLACTEIVPSFLIGNYYVSLTAPPTAIVAPSGYYLLTVVNGGIPSKAEWIHFGL